MTRPGGLPGGRDTRALLVGRQRELDVVLGLLARPNVFLVTLVGPAGAGTTRIAEEIAARWSGPVRFANGAGPPGDGEDSSGSLLVVDDADGERVSRWVRSRTTVLATAMRPLGIAGERIVPIAPLPLPSVDPVGASRPFEGTADDLFLRTVTSLDPDFERTEDNVALVIELCRRLDGLPLAIELAATHVARTQDLGGLAAGSTVLELLDDGARSVGRSLAARYDALDPPTQTTFRRVATFAGGFTRDDAVEIDVADPPMPGSETIEHLVTLTEIGFLSEEAGTETRFRLLSTAREFGWARAVAAGESDRLECRHASHFAQLAHGAAQLFVTPGERHGIVRLEHARDDVELALTWLVDRGETRAALRLFADLGPLWLRRGYTMDLEPLESLLVEATGPFMEASEGAEALLWSAALAIDRFGDPEQRRRAVERAAQAVELARRSGSVPVLLRALWVNVRVLAYTGRLVAARADADEGQRLAEELGLETWDLSFRYWVSLTANLRGDPVAATEPAVSAFLMAERLQEPGLLARTAMVFDLAPFAVVSLRRPPLERLLELAQEGRDAHAEGLLHARLAQRDLSVRNVIGAAGWCARGLELAAQTRHYHIGVFLTMQLVAVAIARSDSDTVARLHGGLVPILPDVQPAMPPAVHQRYFTMVARARVSENPARFDRGVVDGSRVGADETFRRALAYARSVATGPPAAAGPDAGLTERERQVLQLVAQGSSNKDVARRLGLTPKTVMHHTTSIYRKLRVTSRTEAAVWAIREGLAGDPGDPDPDCP